MHICAEQPSSMHFYMPWTVNEFGYTSTLIMQLQKFEMTTGLEFRKLLECESMEVCGIYVQSFAAAFTDGNDI